MVKGPQGPYFAPPRGDAYRDEYVDSVSPVRSLHMTRHAALPCAHPLRLHECGFFLGRGGEGRGGVGGGGPFRVRKVGVTRGETKRKLGAQKMRIQKCKKCKEIY